jgi:hypothetical protein
VEKMSKTYLPRQGFQQAARQLSSGTWSHEQTQGFLNNKFNYQSINQRRWQKQVL